MAFRRPVVSAVRQLCTSHGVQSSNRFVFSASAYQQSRGFSASTSNSAAGGASGESGSSSGIIAGLVGGALAAVAVTFAQERFGSSPAAVELKSPTTPMSGIVADVASKIANDTQKAFPVDKLPVISKQEEFLAFAPNVPPPITRKTPAKLIVRMTSTVKTSKISPTETYDFWTYNDSVPGPMIRCRVGDVLEVHHTNFDINGIGHNIDFHSATGPGGGAPVLYAEQNETKVGWFRMLQPGLYVYHCAAGPVPVHVANGMYGLVLVEPEDGMPPVDKEFYVMQSEFYTEPGKDGKVEFSYQRGLEENPSHVCFNGRVGALTENPLVTKQGDKIRMYVGNGGPNLVSSFHVIGVIFDRVYREGDMTSAPARGLQTTIVPAGGSSVVEFDAIVPGNFTIVDHSIFRIEKGCVGFLKVMGDPRPDVYCSREHPNPCPNCKLHN